MLNENDFDLTSTDEITSESLGIEKVDAELISDPNDIERMSLSVQKQNKEALAQLRKKVAFTLDNRKLAEAQNLLTGMENIGAMFSDEEIIARVKSNVQTAMDLKFLAEAYERMFKAQQNLMRLDTIDGSGTAKRISIGVQYEDESSGTKLQTVVKVGD